MKVFLTLLLVLIFSLGFWTNMEQNAEFLNNEAFERAIYTFALSKGLNAIISVLQSSEVNLSFFVGATVGLGQILDPINDMVERFSWVMLVSSVSIKVQHLLLILSKSSVMKVLMGILICVVLAVVWFKKLYSLKIYSVALKSFFIVAILQFITPLFILGSQLIYEDIYKQEYENANSYINVYKNDLEAVKKDENNLDSFMKKYENKAETFTKKVISLITIFIVTTVLLPLFSIVVLYYLIRFVLFVELDTGFLNYDKAKNVAV